MSHRLSLLRLGGGPQRCWLVVLIWLALGLPTAALSQALVRLDDSSSPRPTVKAPEVLDEHGRPLASSIDARWAVIPFGWVTWRLSTASYVGRHVRIYYQIPSSIAGLRSPSGLEVEWRSQGRFAGGRAHAGERALVWSGVVQEPWLIESLELTARLRLREMELRPGNMFGFESFFMIEVQR